MFDPRREPPETLYLALSTADVCNFRCRHCHIWRHELRATDVTLGDRARWVREFAALKPGGHVVLTGGEVTLDLPELLAIARVCRESELALYAMSNGLLIDNPTVAGQLVASGVTHFVVSLDSHLRAIHAYTRGRENAFEETTGAIRLLVEERNRVGAGMRVLVATVLFKENLALFPAFVRFCRGLGVDHVDFQLLAPTFANAHPRRDVFYERHFWHTKVEKLAAIELFRSILTPEAVADGFVLKRPEDLEWIERYVDDPAFTTSQPVCGSHHMNLILDLDGNAALCFNTRQILGDPFIGNALASSLGDLWSGGKAAEDRAVMDQCRLSCGTLNCHRRRDTASP